MDGAAAMPDAYWRQRFASTYRPVPVQASDVCDKISKDFNESIVDHVLVIISHGSIVDDGTGKDLIQPMFKTSNPVIFPVRYGSSLLLNDDHMQHIIQHLPLASGIPMTGQTLINGLKRSLDPSNACIRQYDKGSNVPNLKIFTPGEDSNDDDILLYDRVHGKFESIIDYFTKLKDIKSVRKKIIDMTIRGETKRVNVNPTYKTRRAHKQIMNQPKEHQVSLADFCDDADGFFKKRGFGKIPVVVLACRSGIVLHPSSGSGVSGSGILGIPVDSPLSEHYYIPHVASTDGDYSPAFAHDDDDFLGLHDKRARESTALAPVDGPDFQGSAALVHDEFHEWPQDWSTHFSPDDKFDNFEFDGGKSKNGKKYKKTRRNRRNRRNAATKKRRN